LTSYNRDWSIKGGDLAKITIYEYHNVNAGGKVFRFDIMENEGLKIHFTSFNAYVDKLYNFFHTNSIYIITNIHIEKAKN